LQGWNNLDLSGLTLGVFWPWFRHANPEVVVICEALLAEFQQMGAGLCEITIPDLEASRVAHTITIAGEMTQAMGHTYDAHQRDYCLDVRTNLALARQFTTRDYLQAQRVRTRLIANFNRALEEADVIITPTVAITAPPIPPGALPDGESDLSTLMEVLRFTPPANMVGLPAISFPAGYDQAGLPVGMQVIGRPWQEHTLLRLALAAEQIVERAPPKVYYDILGS
jgi:Asp-tRNA(Asn)/Glu-tRNA(Gln) amidotransferase A subunit family amidase